MAQCLVAKKLEILEEMAECIGWPDNYGRLFLLDASQNVSKLRYQHFFCNFLENLENMEQCRPPTQILFRNLFFLSLLLLHKMHLLLRVRGTNIGLGKRVSNLICC